MKKTLSLLLALLLLLSSSCQANFFNITKPTEASVTTVATTSKVELNKKNINKIITYIEANDLDNALKECKKLSADAKAQGVEDILNCLLKKLKSYLNSSNWNKEGRYLVNENYIEDFKIYDQILSLLPLEDVFTNAHTFVKTVLKLQKYIEWNEFYSKSDDTIYKIDEYMNTGKSYRNTSWNIAVSYYEKAYTLADNAYYKYNGSNAKGMKEAATYYRTYATMIDNIINRKTSTAAQDNAYDKAIDNYIAISEELIQAISEVIAIMESFPTKLY